MSAPSASMRTYIGPASISLDLSARTKNEAIGQLIDLLVAAGAISDRAVFTADVLAREAKSTTGIGDGIAIPHGKSSGVSRSAVAFAKSKAGIDWGSPDGQPATLLFLIAVPVENVGDEHLRILARLARALVRAPFRSGLSAAETANDALSVLDTV